MDEERIKKLSRKVDVDIFIKNFQDVLDYMKHMKKNVEYIYIEYKGEKLYAMLDDQDSICQKILGVSYKEYKKDKKNFLKSLEEKEIKAELAALDKIPLWIEKGNKLIPAYKQKLWKKTVKSSAKDLYKGADAEATIEMMEALNEGKEYDEVMNILMNGDHSGGSAMSALYTVANFADRGPEFFRYYNNKSGALKIQGLDEYLDKIESDNAAHREESEKNKFINKTYSYDLVAFIKYF